MKFGKHLFISYAHLDNQPVAENDVGWVSRFHRSLDAILSMRLGCKAEIWRDERLQGNDVFAQEIVSQFPETAALVAVVSPRYVQSEWCLREARSFCESALKSGGVTVGNQSRIFKVITLPVESQDPLPAPMRDTLGFDFYVREPNGVEMALNPAYDPALGPKLANECVRLAQSIAGVRQEARNSVRTRYDGNARRAGQAGDLPGGVQQGSPRRSRGAAYRTADARLPSAARGAVVERRRAIHGGSFAAAGRECVGRPPGRRLVRRGVRRRKPEIGRRAAERAGGSACTSRRAAAHHLVARRRRGPPTPGNKFSSTRCIANPTSNSPPT